MELIAGTCAWATRAVSDTTPAHANSPTRTRQATPSPRTSPLQSFIPHTPFVVPFGCSNTSSIHEKGRRYPQESPIQALPLVQAFSLRATTPTYPLTSP